jgi:hypothetical protein
MRKVFRAATMQGPGPAPRDPDPALNMADTALWQHPWQQIAILARGIAAIAWSGGLAPRVRWMRWMGWSVPRRPDAAN